MAKKQQHLTSAQQKYLSERAFYDTDAAAARAIGVHASTVSGWNSDPFFREQLESIWEGDRRRTQEILGRSRDKAALTFEKLLSSRDPRTRRAAAADILDRTGFARGVEHVHGVSDALAALLAAAKNEPAAP